eukprot:5678887-Pleurochrysis_carterae.AAC.1
MATTSYCQYITDAAKVLSILRHTWVWAMQPMRNGYNCPMLALNLLSIRISHHHACALSTSKLLANVQRDDRPDAPLCGHASRSVMESELLPRDRMSQYANIHGGSPQDRCMTPVPFKM